MPVPHSTATRWVIIGDRAAHIEAPNDGAVVGFLDHNASVKVYLDHTHSPPTIRIEVTASSSPDDYSLTEQSFAVELPEPRAQK